MEQESRAKSRWFGHPALIGVIAAALLVDFVSIPSTNWQISTTHRAVFGNLNLSTAHGRPVHGDLMRTEDGFQWWFPWEQEYEQLMRYPLAEVRVGVFRDLRRDEGFYHLTRRTEQFYVYSDYLSPEEEDAVLASLLVAFERVPEAETFSYFVADLIRAGVRRRVTPIYSGYARNGVAILLAVALVVCCTLGKPWLWRPQMYRSRARRIARGLCPECGYDLAGLNTSRCPECGQECGGQESAQP
ncbi:MAG: hypothetical protein IID31_09240 [Planctomycetes bacterium]|nr:hypothetical protein [Planctomycetota bacterium]